MIAAELFPRLDVALWNPAAVAADIESLCALAVKHKFRAICVNSDRVGLAAARLDEADVKLVSLVGFPLGVADADVQRYEAEVAIDHGAHELELVLASGHLRDGAQKQLLRDLRDVVEAAEERPVCVTLETARLTRAEIQQAGQIVLEAGVAGVATATDFWPETGVSADEVRLLRETLGPKPFIKAVGFARNPPALKEMLAAGATRIGTIFTPELLTGFG